MSSVGKLRLAAPTEKEAVLNRFGLVLNTHEIVALVYECGDLVLRSILSENPTFEECQDIEEKINILETERKERDEHRILDIDPRRTKFTLIRNRNNGEDCFSFYSQPGVT